MDYGDCFVLPLQNDSYKISVIRWTKKMVGEVFTMHNMWVMMTPVGHVHMTNQCWHFLWALKSMTI